MEGRWKRVSGNFTPNDNFSYIEFLFQKYLLELSLHATKSLMVKKYTIYRVLNK